MSANRVAIRVRYALSVVLGLLFLSPLTCWAQESTGTILGTVSDPQGAVIPGASVTATNTDTHFTRTVPTEANGEYRVPALPVGNYEVSVTKDGFQTSRRAGLVLQVAQEAVVNIAMAVGSTAQTVEVTEQAPLVDTTDASVGAVVNQQSVADLPLNGRSWANLTLEQAGIAQTFLNAPTAGEAVFQPGVVFSADGAPIRSNNTMLDGAVMQTMQGATPGSSSGSTLGLDGIQEYRVITSVASAEYPLLMGSQTIIASKGGTNSFHGDGFEYLRNNSLDARNYFDPLDTGDALGFGTDKSAAWPDKRLPPFRRSNFGGAVGGPVQKDKTFFYAVYEGLREQKGLSTTTNTLPQACYTGLNGTFLGLPNSPTGGLLPVACTGGTALFGANNNPMPVSPVAQELLMQNNQGGPLNPAFFPSGILFPAPNLPQQAAYNYTFPSVQPTNENYGQLRLDHSFSGKDSMFARYTHDQTAVILPASYPTIHTLENSLAQYATASESHVFSPTLLQTVRFSFSRTNVDVHANEVAGADEKSVVGNRGAATIDLALAPNGSPTSYGLAGPGVYYQKLSTTSYDLIWTRGKHSIKMGALWNYFDNPGSGISFFNQGDMVFLSPPGLFAGQYYTIFFQPSYATSIRNLSYHTIGFYGEDDFRVTPRLTLNLGLRYEFATDPNGPNHYADENPATFAPVLGTNYNGTGVPIWGTRAGLYAHSPGLHNFGPRVGFAWDIFGTGKTALRGGGGLYYDVVTQGGLMVQENFWGLPAAQPFNYNIGASPLVVTPPGTGLLDPLASARPLGCATISLPTYPACSQGSLQFNAQQPSMAQWNLSIDQQLPWGMAMTLSYVGTAGWHLWKHQDSNYVDATIDANGNYEPLQLNSQGVPHYCVLAADGACAFAENPNVSAATATNVVNNLTNQRLNPNLGLDDDAVTTSRSWYNAMQFVVHKNLTHGLQFQSAFTWAKLMDLGQDQDGADSTQYTTVPTGPLGNNEAHLAQGVSSLNLTRNWQVSAIYHIPDVHSDARWSKALKGWWTAPILAFRSGFPFTPTLSSCARLAINALFLPGVTCVPNRAADYNASTVITGKVTQWFDPTQFALQNAGTNGNAGYNYLNGPNGRNLDLSLNKDTKVGFLGEQGVIQFRAEVFNIFNHPAFAQPNTAVYAPSTSLGQLPGQIVSATATSLYAASPSAGAITSTFTSSRQIQFALKFIF